jgi:phage/plasmid-like protein (TIGR03299 family)
MTYPEAHYVSLGMCHPVHHNFAPLGSFTGKYKMAHLIETNAITGKAEIAYVGAKPWHGLGQDLSPNAPMEVWRKEAGLDWDAEVTPVLFKPNDSLSSMVAITGRKVIYRNDTNQPLGVVTDRYRIHQPDQILDFFNTLVSSAGFTLETAGCISGGKRIWALANVNKEACVLADDAVRGYLLLSTSFDGSTATVGQFTSVRVVCNNTLSMADREAAPSRVSITHGARFDASLMRDRLGLVVGGFEGMMDNYRKLARTGVSQNYVKDFLSELFPPTQQQVKIEGVKQKQIVMADSRSYKKVLELFDGKGMGADMQGASGTRWGLLNAVTQYVDHDKGHNADTRMTNAWFGDGNRLKSKAEALLLV